MSRLFNFISKVKNTIVIIYPAIFVTFITIFPLTFELKQFLKGIRIAIY